MKIADGIAMLELDLGRMVLCPTVLFNQDTWILVDTGMPGNAPAIIELAKQEGIGNQKLDTILLTHQDIDHIGGLPAFIGNPVVYAHEDDKEVINGKQPLLKVPAERMTRLLASMSVELRSQFEAAFIHPTRANVDRTMEDGETLPFAGGVKVIHTPGHTPGHVSLYHMASKTLIAGDSMVIKDGELRVPREEVTPNMKQALQSLKKYKDFDIANVICYHGGLLQGDINSMIAALTEQG